jgi:hypothetical protein
MTWSGKPVEAILDTGSYWVVWPETLHLTSTKTSIPQEGFMAAGVTTDGEWRILPSIKAGGCEWREMPSIADGKIKVPVLPSNKQSSLALIVLPRPLLDIPAFRNLVFTIDYQKKQIILRRSDCDMKLDISLIRHCNAKHNLQEPFSCRPAAAGHRFGASRALENHGIDAARRRLHADVVG